MSLQVWLPLNGNLTQQGLSNIEVTNNGATINNDGKIGKCYYFNGSSYLSIPYDYESFNGVFSAALWVKFPSTVTSNTEILNLANSAGWASIYFGMVIPANSTNIACSISNGTNYLATAASSGNIGTNIWTHIACTYDLKILKIYVNGELKTSYNTTIVPNFSAATKIGIGAASNGQEKSISYINDVRIYDHCLSAKEVKIISQGLILHYPLNDPYIESATNLISNGDISNTCFNATLSKYGFGSETNIYKTTGEFQGRECTKIYMGTENQTGYPYVHFSNLTAAIGETRTLSFDYFPTKLDKIVFYTYKTAGTTVWSNGANKGVGNGDTTIPVNLNRWNHISISITNTGEATDGWGYMRIGSGSHISTTTDYWLFDNVMVVNGSVEKPFTLGTREANNIIYDTSGYCNNGTASGALATSNDTSKYDYSTEFDGTDNTILVPYDANIWQTNFTINIWFKKNELGTKNYETLFGGPSGFEMDTRASSATTLTLFMASARGGNITGNNFSSFNFSEWYMVTLVNDGTNELYYVNGNFIKSITKKSMPVGQYYIGSWNTATSQNYKGLISDFRIYATALSAEDIAELYSVGASIDNQGNVYSAMIQEV